MAKTNQLSVASQVMLLFGLICAILVAIGLFLFFSLRNIETKNKKLEAQILNEWTLNNAIADNLRMEQDEVIQNLTEQDSSEWQYHERNISRLKKANADKWNEYGKLVDNEMETNLYATALADQKKYFETTDALLALSVANKQDEARDFALSAQAPAYEAYQKAITDISDWTAKEGGDMATDSSRVIVQTRIIGDALVGLAMLVSIGAATSLVGITRRLKQDNLLLQTEVAERKRAEEISHESEEKFRQLAENITDVFWITTPDQQNVLYVSPAYEGIWGRPAESQYANPHQWSEAIFPDDRERVFSVFSGLRSDQPSISVEYRIARPDGTVRWIHDRGFQVRDATGCVIRLAGIATDITKQRQAHQEFEDNRQLLDSVLKNSVDGIMAFKSVRDEKSDLIDFRFLLVNPAAERLLGKSASDLVGQDLLEASPEIVLDGLFETFVRIIETGEVLDFEYSTVRSNALRWYRVAGVKLGDGLVMNYSDVTERKLAQAQLDRLRNEHQAILNSVSEGVHWIDNSGNIKFENCAAANLLGYEPCELLGRPGHSTMHHTHADGSPYPVEDCPIYATLKDGVVRHVEDEIFWRKDGTSFPVVYTATSVRDDNGQLAGTVIVFTDVTERKRIEARLFQSQKMETVGRLAGGVAHEFNSILTAIIGQSELLLNDLSTDDPSGKCAMEIRQAAERAAVLTRQLLAYGRKQILQPEILDLNLVLSNMVSTLQHLMSSEVDVRIAPTLGLKKVKIDPGQMEQVIVSIAMNAADAMPNGGRLTLETSNVILDEAYVYPFPGLKPGDYVMLAITDTGAGMSDEVKARAFEPFFSTKGVGQGTGLGLATCYGIIKQSDGHIGIYSEVGRGTTFKIYLPQFEQSAKTSHPHLNIPGMPVGTETILLAEDDPSLLEMSASLLRRLGYTVITAANGIEALSLKNKKNIGHIDLLLTDVVMPHMSGKELSDRIRVIYPYTKILFTSAYTESAIVPSGRIERRRHVVTKAFHSFGTGA